MEPSLDFTSSARIIKAQVTLRQVIESYGIKITNKHICCPFHSENTPSFKVYQEDTEEGNFYCYGCQKAGDVISFVAYKENCNAGQALAKIAKAFRIPLVTKETTPDTLVTNLSLILGKKKKETPKEITELVHWQVMAERCDREFETMGTEPTEYLKRKKLNHCETRSKFGVLIVPMRDIKENIWAFQQIQSDGTKMFLVNAKKQDLMLRLGPVAPKAFIAEGWATAETVHQITGITTYVAFTANNIDSVAEQLKDKYQGIQLVVAGDNDESGHMHHQKAVYPARYKSDWSDLYLEEGPEKVEILLSNAFVGV